MGDRKWLTVARASAAADADWMFAEFAHNATVPSHGAFTAEELKHQREIIDFLVHLDKPFVFLTLCAERPDQMLPVRGQPDRHGMRNGLNWCQ
jgi:hypothetical protein